METGSPTRIDALAPDDVQKLLRDWLLLNADIMELSLPALRQLVDAELGGKRRPLFLLRIYGRFNRLRALSEKQKLLRGESLWEEGKMKW